MLFTPDVLPVNVNADTDGQTDNHSITVPKSAMTYTDQVYSEMNLDATTSIDVGDFIVFYSGVMSESETAPTILSYVKITTIIHDGDKYVIQYEDTTEADMIATTMEMYDNRDLKGEDLLKDVDVKQVEQSIVKQVKNSGFAEEASSYLAALALETENFKTLAGDMDLSSYNISVKNGDEMSPSELALMAGKPTLENLKIKAELSTTLKHFEGDLSGLRCAVQISFDLEFDNGDNKVIISVTGTFEEEVRISINVSSDTIWKMKWKIFPYIDDYRLNANVDVYNFTGVAVDAKIGLVSGDSPSGMPEEWEDIAGELEALLEAAEDGKEAVGGVEGIGSSLADKYKAMMDAETEWVDLFTEALTDTEAPLDCFHILCYGFKVEFVVSASMNMSIGFELMYTNAKRYSFVVGLKSKTATNDVTVLVEESYEFTFYVMGTIGVRAGIRMTVQIGLFSLDLDSVGISAEVGAYARLWGYFYYHVKWTKATGKISNATGALLLEVGIYMEIKFIAQVFNGRFSYNPTLYENEWPLWVAGTQENVQGFAYPQPEAPKLELKNTNRTSIVPRSAFEMTYMDMKTGVVSNKVIDDTKFTVTMTNPVFSYDAANDTLTVAPGQDSYEEKGQMIIEWKAEQLSFSSIAPKRTIDLAWENLANANTMNFNTTGGSGINPIAAGPGVPITKPVAPTKQGYVFGGWYGDANYSQAYTIPDTMPTAKNTQVYAKWNPAQDTKYIVEHYQQNLANSRQYTLMDTEMLTGTTDSNAPTTFKTYEGFTAPRAQSVKIMPDGSTKVRYEYSRNSYQLTFSRGTQTEDGDNVVSMLKFGAAINPPMLASGGYTFNTWDVSKEDMPKTMPAKAVTITALWTANKDTPFRVEHYVQNPNGVGYGLSSLEMKAGETDSVATLDDYKKEAEGYMYKSGTVDGKATTTTTIAKNGTRVIKLLYDRKSYKITFQVIGSAKQEQSHLFGSQTNEIETPKKTGYTFGGWYDEETLVTPHVFGVMPAADIAVYGTFIPSENTNYMVQHYVMQPNGIDYEMKKEVTLEGKTDSTIADLSALKNTEYEVDGGIAYKNAKVGSTVKTEAVIAADGSLVVKLYYDRASHTMTFVPENGGVNTVKELVYGAALTAPTLVKQGYTLTGWNPAVPETVPTTNATYTAVWEASTSTAYKVEHHLQNASGVDYTIDTAQTENETGTTGVTVTAGQKTIAHYTYNAQKSAATASGAVALDGSLVLKLYYDRVEYTLTYESDGKIFATETYRHGADVVYPTVEPELEGYTFLKWQVGESDFNKKMPTNNLTLVAKFTQGQSKYTVNHHVMGTDGTYPTSVPTELVEVIPANTEAVITTSGLKKTAYEVLDGIAYLEAKVGENIVTSATVLANGSLVIDLYYARTQHTLAWDANGGTLTGGTTAGPVYYGAAITAPTGTREHYKMSWNKTVPATMPAADATYQAQWALIDYAITYRDKGDGAFSGTSLPTLTTYQFGNTKTLSTPSKPNYDFVGWFSDSGCTIAASGIAATDFGAKTFYAKWAAKSYGITYTLNGGNNSGTNPATYEYGKPVTLAGASGKTGYTFAGWYTDAGLSTAAPIPQITATTTGAQTFYAKWTAITYTVTFNANNGIGGPMTAQTFTHDVNSKLTKNMFTRPGYAFAGWAKSAQGAMAYADEAETAMSEDTTLYALWTKESYAITYELNGHGVPNVNNPSSYDGAVAIKLAELAAISGYTFAGWHTDSTLSPESKIAAGADAISVGDSGAKTFYAKWEKAYVEIGSVTQLKNARDAINNVSGTTPEGREAFYKLTATLIYDANTDGTWTPIGTEAAPFIGEFVGAETSGTKHGISGLDKMLFDVVGTGGLVENIQVSVPGQLNLNKHGGLVGQLLSGGTVQNCTVTGTTNTAGAYGEGNLGGLVGVNSGTIIGCVSEVIFNLGNKGASVSVGALVGLNSSGKILNSKATGRINAPPAGTYNEAGIGGLVGETTGISEIRNSTGAIVEPFIYQRNPSAPLIATEKRIGGIIGSSTGSLIMDRCSSETPAAARNGASGDRSWIGQVGGLIGYVFTAVGEVVRITNSQNTNTTASYAEREVGGLIGEADGLGTLELINCQQEGQVSRTVTAQLPIDVTPNAGGLIGVLNMANARIENCITWASGQAHRPAALIGAVGAKATNVVIKNSYWYDSDAFTITAFETIGIATIEGCGTFTDENSAVVAATSNKLVPSTSVTTPSDQVLTYTGTPLEVLNAWVTAKNAEGEDYASWAAAESLYKFRIVVE